MPSAVLSAATGADREVVAAKAGYKIRVFGWVASNATQATLTFKSATTAKTGAMPAAANGQITAFFARGIFDCTVAEALNATASAGTALGVVRYEYVTAGDPNV